MGASRYRISLRQQRKVRRGPRHVVGGIRAEGEARPSHAAYPRGLEIRRTTFFRPAALITPFAIAPEVRGPGLGPPLTLT